MTAVHGVLIDWLFPTHKAQAVTLGMVLPPPPQLVGFVGPMVITAVMTAWSALILPVKDEGGCDH